jgi:hypothetical protein
MRVLAVLCLSLVVLANAGGGEGKSTKIHVGFLNSTMPRSRDAERLWRLMLTLSGFLFPLLGLQLTQIAR